jgi:hypothetical protein
MRARLRERLLRLSRGSAATAQTREVDVLTPQQLLESFDGCPACALPDNVQLAPGPPNQDVAYQHDLSGATVDDAALTGSFAGWDLSGAGLEGASPNGDVSGAAFRSGRGRQR